MAGGQGNDTYVVGQTGDSVTEAAGEGTDTVRSTIAYTLGNNLENLELTGAGNLSGTGNSLNNRIIGNSGNNRLIGNAGNDQGKIMNVFRSNCSSRPEDRGVILCPLVEGIRMDHVQDLKRRFVDPSLFGGFSKITLLSATVVGSLPALYFKHLVDAELLESDLVVRGNPMLNRVTIYPLMRFEDDRDHCGIEPVAAVIDMLVGKVQGHALGSADEQMIGVGNKTWQDAIRNKEPIELIPTVCHGLNKWSDATMAAALSCVNPTT